MQSWGFSSRFEERDTALEPTRSGVIGLCCAALGIGRDDSKALGQFASLAMAVRVDKQGVVMTDYQTAGGGTFDGKSYGVYRASGESGGTVLSRRALLADASFLVALGGDAHELIESIDDALSNPRWPLFLGRRGFVPARPIRSGVTSSGPIEALSVHDLPSATNERRSLRLVVEVASGGLPRTDVPLSFSSAQRSFGVRFVELRSLPIGVQ
jgi:CRISPR system Cascade subunit CasD